jgi:hypothetical protein
MGRYFKEAITIFLNIHFWNILREYINIKGTKIRIRKTVLYICLWNKLQRKSKPNSRRLAILFQTFTKDWFDSAES